MRARVRLAVGGFAVAAVLAVLPTEGGAQLSARIAAVEDGTVRFGYRARPEVEVCEQGVRMGERQIWWRSRYGEDDRGTCRSGYVEVDVRRVASAVRSVDIVRDFGPAGAGVVDLGEVEPRAAVEALTAIAHDRAAGDGAEDAVLPAFLADVQDPWAEFLALARDGSVRTDVRKTTIFWLGQAAADVATEGLTALAFEDDEEQDIRDAAVFALSQRPADQAVPALVQLAREADQAETRRTALFWLAQSDDPRVVAFFEEILLGRAP